MVEVLKTIAILRDASEDEIAEATTANAIRVFGKGRAATG
jgi:Tat protein secretion system quality control protein TatD with DNase activity